jgi:hypothetical protein
LRDFNAALYGKLYVDEFTKKCSSHHKDHGEHEDSHNTERKNSSCMPSIARNYPFAHKPYALDVPWWVFTGVHSGKGITRW